MRIEDRAAAIATAIFAAGDEPNSPTTRIAFKSGTILDVIEGSEREQGGLDRVALTRLLVRALNQWWPEPIQPSEDE